MKNLTLLIKPCSSKCDLNCNYCFYKNISKSRKISDTGFMSKNTLRTIVENAFKENIDCINFMFQGGEPTLINLDFYKYLIYLQNKFNKNNIKIINSIQTNGHNIDLDYIKFFKDNNFLVGVSLDGPEFIHDLNRLSLDKSKTFNKIMSTIKLLKQYDIEFNILCVITNYSSQYINDIYEFFKDNNFKYIQFIPCIKTIDSNDSYVMTSNNYYIFLSNLFDLWFKDFLNNNYIYIRNFMDYIEVLKGLTPNSCGMGGFCSIHTVIEANGDVYPCDFYCIDDWKLGNVHDNLFSEMRFNDTSRLFFNRSLNISNNCKSCKYFKLCGGGCRKNLNLVSNKSNPYNYQCIPFVKFLNKNIKKLLYVSRNFE